MGRRLYPQIPNLNPVYTVEGLGVSQIPIRTDIGPGGEGQAESSPGRHVLGNSLVSSFEGR